MSTAHNPKYAYVPASSLASRRIIEQSSYNTTPDHSPYASTPPCGEWVSSTTLDTKDMETVHSAIRMMRDSETKTPKHDSEIKRGSGGGMEEEDAEEAEEEEEEEEKC